MINHNKIYSGALATLCILAATSAGLLLFLTGVSASGSTNTHLPDSSIPWVAAVNFGYFIAICEKIAVCIIYALPATSASHKPSLFR